MKRVTITTGFAALSLAFAMFGVAGVAGAQVKPPAPSALRPYVFPRVDQFTLENGLKVIVVENHTVPIVEGRVMIDAGSLREPASKNGLASLAGRLLAEGTGDLSGAEIARRMESMGASYTAAGGFSTSFADVVALKNVFADALTLAAQTVIAPSFPESDFNRVKNMALAAYQQRRAQGGSLAYDAFVLAAFDSTAPFSRPSGGTTATLRGLSRDDVMNWHRTMFAPSASTLLLVGDITPADARAIAQRAFGGWRATRAAMAPVANPVQKFTGTRVILVDRPTSVQSSIVIGQAGFQATDPDYLAMLALNNVFGGPFSSRLNTNLREKHGYTYGASSSLDVRAGAGAYQLSSDVRTSATDSALVEAIAEYRRIVAEMVPAAELQGAVSNLVAGFPGSVQTVQGLSARLQALIIWGLPIEYYATYRERLAAVTPADVHKVATSRLTPDNLLIVVAGDVSRIEAPIRARNLGQVEVWDSNGNKLR